jgi:transposase
MRLVLVLDERSGLPVWYTIIAGNLLDLSTLEGTLGDVAESLDVRISSFVLDAGYASAEVLKYFHSGEGAGKSLPVRMPPKNGYPYKSLYHRARPLMANAKHEFIRAGHTYFAKRYETEVLKVLVHAYVYVDKDNALSGSRKWRLNHEKEYEKLSEGEKNWLSVRFGFFVLISTEAKGADELLDDYLGRTNIESVFKTRGEYLDLCLRAPAGGEHARNH